MKAIAFSIIAAGTVVADAYATAHGKNQSGGFYAFFFLSAIIGVLCS